MAETVTAALKPTGEEAAAVPVGERTENNSVIVAHYSFRSMLRFKPPFYGGFVQKILC